MNSGFEHPPESRRSDDNDPPTTAARVQADTNTVDTLCASVRTSPDTSQILSSTFTLMWPEIELDATHELFWVEVTIHLRDGGRLDEVDVPKLSKG